MATNDTRVLVTGGAGFIGSHVVRTLAAQGSTLAIVDNLSSGKEENLLAGVPFFNLDIRDKPALEAAFDEFKPTQVIHLAGDSSSRIGCDNLSYLLETNILGSMNVFEACKIVGAQKLIFASTAGVYGEVADGTEAKESDLFNPMSAYAASKASFELFLSALGEKRSLQDHSKDIQSIDNHAKDILEEGVQSKSLQSVVLRLANVYGPRQQASTDGGVVAIFTQKLLTQQPIDLYSAKVEGDGGCYRNFVFIDDVVAAIVCVLDETIEGTFNVAANDVHRTEELLRVVSQVVGVTPETHTNPPRVSEIKRSALDCSKLMSLGWRPEISLRDGVTKTVAYFRSSVSQKSDYEHSILDREPKLTDKVCKARMNRVKLNDKDILNQEQTESRID